jgi:hypothetical protein
MSIDNNMDDVENKNFSLNDFKIPPKPIKSKQITSIDKSILNSIDISPELIEVNNFAVDLLIQLSSMIQIVYTFIQD